jgi:hypothetical protein
MTMRCKMQCNAMRCEGYAEAETGKQSRHTYCVLALELWAAAAVKVEDQVSIRDVDERVRFVI